MFGYATDETEECMPLTVTLSHALNKRIATCRRNGILPWAGPDSKTQVSFFVILQNQSSVLTWYFICPVYAQVYLHNKDSQTFQNMFPTSHCKRLTTIAV